MSQETIKPYRTGYPWKTALLGAAIIIFVPWLFLWFDSLTSTGTVYALIQLVLVNPVVFIVGSARSWVRYRWRAAFTACVFAAAFLVSVFWVYNSSALVYLIAYLILALVSIAIAEAVIRLNRSAK